MTQLPSLSTDASVFEIHPLESVTPASQDALVREVQAALAAHRPLTLRAGGTSLGGQAIGSGVVIDVSRHLTHILDY
ncbi:MAG: FAD-binding oxidoreductase, partial [Thiotrichales bacterium]|nr:FAD-binding oxidoreductase [Thiotrichales bacterium]